MNNRQNHWKSFLRLSATLWGGMFCGVEITVAQQNNSGIKDVTSKLYSSARSWKFDFGTATPRPGWINVTSEMSYDSQVGYGFDFGTKPASGNHEFSHSPKRNVITGASPFYFSVLLPEGNYDVVIMFGDDKHASDNTVKSESRRLMLERVTTEPGETKTASFTVNVRSPALQEGGQVTLKPREKNVLHWDEKLTIEFNGECPVIREIEIVTAPRAVTVFLLGDSTVADQPHEPWNSWGQMLPRFFNAGVAVANHAESGESLKGTLHARRVQKVFESMRPGDYLFVQFGHNDMKDRDKNALETFRANLKNLVDDTRSLGGIPVLITSMERKAGVHQPTLGAYPQTVRDIAQEKQVFLIDLNRMSVHLYRALGENLDHAFQDGSHHNAYGSYELARCVVYGIRESLPELASHLRSDVPKFSLSHPDPFDKWHVPASPGRDVTTPDGN